MKTKRIIFPFLLSVALMIIGCNNNPGGDDPSERKDSDTVVVVKDTIPTRPNNATMLFDASGSMCGYLTTSDSRFGGVISFWGNIPSSVKVRLFGKTEGNPIEMDDFDDMLTTKSIEWSSESNLKSMIRSMISHVGNGDDVCFLVTDGILSGSNSQINGTTDKSYNLKQREKMSNDLSSMLGEKADELSALIVRYTAKFNGTYSCYNNERKSLVNKDRPFFVIALGNWQNIKYIEDTLNAAKNKNGITTPYDDIVMIGDQNSYEKIKLSAATGLNPKGGKLIVKKENRDGEVELSANITDLPSYMQTQGYMDENIELFIQHGKKGIKPFDKEYFSITVDKASDKSMLKLSIKASQLKDSKLSFKLKFSMPGWVNQFSDDNDLDILSNPSKLNKTFNLKYFVAGFEGLNQNKYIKEQVLEFN